MTTDEDECPHCGRTRAAHHYPGEETDVNRIGKLVSTHPKPADPDEVVSRHQYQRDSQSGAGNCWCGRHEGHRMHSWSDPRDDALDPSGDDAA